MNLLKINIVPLVVLYLTVGKLFYISMVCVPFVLFLPYSKEKDAFEKYSNIDRVRFCTGRSSK